MVPLMKSELGFKIDESAYQHIRDAHLDIDRFKSYLSERRVPEEETAKLDVIITSDCTFSSAEGLYRPRHKDSENSRHAIILNPSYLLNGPHACGKNLRHEAEHFIYEIEHPHYARNKKLALVALTLLGGSAMTLAGAYDPAVTAGYVSPLTEIARSPARNIRDFALGSAFSFVLSFTGRAVVGPSEIKAVLAECSRRSGLPDNVLEVEPLTNV